MVESIAVVPCQGHKSLCEEVTERCQMKVDCQRTDDCRMMAAGYSSLWTRSMACASEDPDLAGIVASKAPADPSSRFARAPHKVAEVLC